MGQIYGPQVKSSFPLTRTQAPCWGYQFGFDHHGHWLLCLRDHFVRSSGFLAALLRAGEGVAHQGQGSEGGGGGGWFWS